MSPLGPPDPTQGGSADTWTPAPPSPVHPAQRFPSRQTLGLEPTGHQAPRLCGLQQGRRTSPLAGGTDQVCLTRLGLDPHPPHPRAYLSFRSGERRDERRPVREQPEPWRERGPARSRKADSVCVLSQSQCLSRMPKGSHRVGGGVCHHGTLRLHTT